MGKLEQKLIQLGYEKPSDLSIINTHELSPNTYMKIIDSVYAIYIKVDNNNIKYYNVGYPNYSVGTQVDAEIYKSAWKILYEDLEELKKMSRLEKKLIELGYEYIDTIIPEGVFFRKQFSKWLFLEITTDLKKNHICDHIIIQIVRHKIDTSQAFNEMQKDLEILKECEE